MDVDFWMVVVFAVGVVVLFLFPEPEGNFLWYGLTAVFFVLVEVGMFYARKRKNK